MFENAISSQWSDQVSAGALRPLDWRELVARLGAARELRALLARPLLAGGGFDPRAATGIAGELASEPGVNLAGLGSGKCADSTTAAAATRADHGDRDK